MSVTNDQAHPRVGLRLTYALTPRLRLVSDAGFSQKFARGVSSLPPAENGVPYHMNRFAFGEGIEGDVLVFGGTRIGVGGLFGVQQETPVSEVKGEVAYGGQTRAFVAPSLFVTHRFTQHVDLLFRAEDRFTNGQGIGGFTWGLRIHR